MNRENQQITHRRLLRSIVFSPRGIALGSRLSRKEILIPWDKIDFISPTPAVERDQGRWRFMDLSRELGLDLPHDHGRFTLDIVLHDCHWLGRRLGWAGPLLHPLTGADDRPEPHRGFFWLDIFQVRLSAPAEELLELLSRHARFDLLCHEGL